MAESGPAPAERRESRIGLLLFAIYVVLYSGFMLLAAWRPEWMGITTPFGSVNLAIMYGMGLILAALLLALIYMVACRRQQAR